MLVPLETFVPTSKYNKILLTRARILLSRPFKFVIGTDEIPITVYEAAIAAQSPALASLVQGGMTESLSAEVKWEDVDKGTFLRFVEFIYSGDYSTPQSLPVQSNQRLSQSLRTGIITEEIMPAEPFLQKAVDVSTDWDTWAESRPKKGKKGDRTRSFPAIPALESFNSLSYPVPKTQSIFANTCEHAIGDGKGENSVFLIHASLYVLADKWGVDSLKQLTLSKLHRALAAFHLDISNVQNLVELVRYAYLDEQTLELEHGTDQLRGLICHYIAANARVTAECAAFTDLLKEEGALASDVWKIAAPRIRVAE
ncbi:uncharacterized protein PAC_01106 [Phialocephala subalpina]|uniref:BTB domain-containing protein n=1 Tax=Phialocephala subalpina TaxID=576137 RepID=A0A1L7WEM2_9HELO|nr:uncharacterized protein PAC_01106 [Phialocephala subalpina]